jgi:transcriptional regulator with XRE-family HTH domain
LERDQGKGINMNHEIIETRKCRECGGLMEGRKGEYRYVESGLNSVTLKEILVFHCTKCNDIVPRIPAAGLLHRIIAIRLLLKKTLLTGSELRFLRKLCGYSIGEFCEIMGSSKMVVGRWENHDAHGEATDRTVRLLFMAKMFRELAGQPEPILKNVTIKQLDEDLEKALKMIDAKRENEKYEISPEEIARFGGYEEVTPITDPSSTASAVN